MCDQRNFFDDFQNTIRSTKNVCQSFLFLFVADRANCQRWCKFLADKIHFYENQVYECFTHKYQVKSLELTANESSCFKYNEWFLYFLRSYFPFYSWNSKMLIDVSNSNYLYRHQIIHIHKTAVRYNLDLEEWYLLCEKVEKSYSIFVHVQSCEKKIQDVSDFLTYILIELSYQSGNVWLYKYVAQHFGVSARLNVIWENEIPKIKVQKRGSCKTEIHEWNQKFEYFPKWIDDAQKLKDGIETSLPKNMQHSCLAETIYRYAVGGLTDVSVPELPVWNVDRKILSDFAQVHTVANYDLYTYWQLTEEFKKIYQEQCFEYKDYQLILDLFDAIFNDRIHVPFNHQKWFMNEALKKYPEIQTLAKEKLTSDQKLVLQTLTMTN